MSGPARPTAMSTAVTTALTPAAASASLCWASPARPGLSSTPVTATPPWTRTPWTPTPRDQLCLETGCEARPGPSPLQRQRRPGEGDPGLLCGQAERIGTALPRGPDQARAEGSFGHHHEVAAVELGGVANDRQILGRGSEGRGRGANGAWSAPVQLGTRDQPGCDTVGELVLAQLGEGGDDLRPHRHQHQGGQGWPPGHGEGDQDGHGR